MEARIVRLHAIVEGLVQGVGFRMFVFEQAKLLNITGWVCNLPDSTVEIIAEGQRPNIEQFILQIETGPRGAYIHNLQLKWSEASGKFTTFEVRRTPYY